MQNRLNLLVRLAKGKGASDIHIVQNENGRLQVFLRIQGRLIPLAQDIFPPSFLEYLRYASGMDLCRPHEPQSGRISVQEEEDQKALCQELRCSFLESAQTASCTLRLLHQARSFSLEQLTRDQSAVFLLKKLCSLEHGLIAACGPTGSGKTTTMHALLARILQQGGRKIVTLEDPVEIRQEGLIQLAVQSQGRLSYEKGIEELMRHDPDVIFLGECRSEYCAAMAVRAALTGHLVFTTLHAGSGVEAMRRLLDLGVRLIDLQVVLQGLIICRLDHTDGQTQSLYTLWQESELESLLHKGANPHPTHVPEPLQSPNRMRRQIQGPRKPGKESKPA